MSGSGSTRGGDNRGNRKKPFNKRRDRDNQARNRENSRNEGKRRPADFSPISDGRPEKRRGPLYDRPKWVAPVPPDVPLPAAACAWCEKPIKVIAEAISEPNSGRPVHLECVINRILERETLERGDTVGYIGGGRFGIIHYNNPPDTRDFKIKKILEWEDKEHRSDWRITMRDHYSLT